MKAKPFVKWAGGKGNLLQQLEALLPADFDNQQHVTYIEPFVGGGAMLFHMLQNHPNIERAVINDINQDLIHCYRLVKDNPQELINELSAIEKEYYSYEPGDQKEVFYAFRDKFNSEALQPTERAALFVFLNHTCFNGLFRVNASGKFNVPFGRYKHPIICNEELLMEDHRLLNSVELIIREPGDYKLVQRNLGRRGLNFVYFDPPYRPLSTTSYFKEYSNSPFGDDQQVELKLFCDRLTDMGCQIMLSNSDSKNDDGSSYFEGLYEGYRYELIFAPRYINAFPKKRVKLTETVIRNY